MSPQPRFRRTYVALVDIGMAGTGTAVHGRDEPIAKGGDCASFLKGQKPVVFQQHDPLVRNLFIDDMRVIQRVRILKEGYIVIQRVPSFAVCRVENRLPVSEMLIQRRPIGLAHNGKGQQDCVQDDQQRPKHRLLHLHSCFFASCPTGMGSTISRLNRSWSMVKSISPPNCWLSSRILRRPNPCSRLFSFVV